VFHLRQRLQPFGIKVVELSPGANPLAELGSAKNLDVVVSGSIAAGEHLSIVVQVFFRGLESPRVVEAVGPSACETAAAGVLRSVTNENAVTNVVHERLARATETLRLKPDDFSSLMTVGYASRLKGDWFEALPIFKHAVELRPKDKDALLNLALCYKETSDLSGWLQNLNLAEEVNPEDSAVLIALGNFYAHAGQDKAIGYYEKVAAMPHAADLANWNLGCFYASRRDFAKAVAALDAIQTSSPFFTEARPWSRRLKEQQAALNAKEIADRTPLKSLWTVSGLPNEFGISLLMISLGLALSPFLGVFKMGPLETSKLSRKVARVMRYVGPVLFVGCVILHIPLIKTINPAVPEVAPLAFVGTEASPEANRYLASR
jgi:hypothetical protein